MYPVYSFYIKVYNIYITVFLLVTRPPAGASILFARTSRKGASGKQNVFSGGGIENGREFGKSGLDQLLGRSR